MQRNLRLSYLTTACFQALFWSGIWISFYLLFTDYQGIGVIELVAYTSSFIFEIPTGAIADFFGKKKTLMAAFFITGLNALIMGAAQNYSMLLISVVLAGLGHALFSGTHHAFIYDSLKSLGREDEYDSILSKLTSIGLVSMAVASVVGGVAYTLLPGLPFYLLALTCLIALIASFYFTEPPIDTDHFSFKEFMTKTSIGFSVLKKSMMNKPLLSILFASSVAVIVIGASLDNALAIYYGLSEATMGALFAVAILAGAVGNFFYERLKNNIGFSALAWLTAGILLGSALIAPFVGMLFGSLAILARFVVYQWPEIQASTVVNESVSSNSRATALSTFSMLSRLPYVLTAVLIGISIERYNAAWTTAGVGGLVLLFGVLLTMGVYHALARVKNN
jgi:MFS family permease